MKQKLKYLLKYLKYRMKAKHSGAYGIHSPFLYDLILDVIEDEIPYYSMDDIWELRQELLADKSEIEVTDLGAGSKAIFSKKRRISDIAKHSGSNEKFGEMLFRFVVRFQPEALLEIGTSLGIGTLYMALPNSKAKVYTIEGCPNTAKIAKDNFSLFEVKNIKQYIGNFDNKLPEILSEIPKLDFVFFDGNHKKEPTLKYFEMCLEKADNKSVFIFDDIYWSDQMEEAWNIIKKHPKVTMTIDLFRFGIVFFNPELSKQNFVVKI